MTVRPIRGLFVLSMGVLLGWAMATHNKTCIGDPGQIRSSYELSRQMARQSERRDQQEERHELAAVCARLAKMGIKNANCP